MGQKGHARMIIDMGVYNIYIWPAYGITVLVFSINIISALYKKYQTKKRIKRKL
jgi:heme exporter protein CcmD